MPTLKELMSGNATADTSSTDAISRLLTAKSGSLAGADSTGGGGAPRQEHVAEDVVRAETSVASQQQAQQLAGQQQQLATQEAAQAQAAQEARSLLNYKERQLVIAASTQAQQISNELKQSQATLDLQQQTDLEESRAAAERLSNEIYVTHLQDEAYRARIVSMADAKEAMLRDELADINIRFQNGLTTADLMKMDDEAFRRELMQLNAEDALAIAAQERNVEAIKSQYSGMQTAIQGAGKAGEAWASGKFDSPSPTDNNINQTWSPEG